MPSNRRAHWGTRFGLYMAAVGSAFGLGNVWRFPYVVAENGGGAFVLVYMAMVFAIGLPFLVGELMLGKITGRSVVPALERLRGQRADLTAPARAGRRGRVLALLTGSGGRLAVFICFLVLAYYAVISGWVLHFLMQFIVGALREGGVEPQESLNALMNNGWLQAMLASVHLIFISVVVAKDVEEGIEKWVGNLMPIFVVLMLVMATKALSMETSGEALRFFLYPDFSRLTRASLGAAIGHVLFTLSLGFGTMVTFGSYLSERSPVPRVGFRVVLLDSVVSVFAGIMVFPLVVGRAHDVNGPQLLFKTVPFMFNQISGGPWFAVGFFLCLYLAAVGASIGLLETVVANLIEVKGMARPRASFFVAVVCFGLAILPSMSSSLLSWIKIGGRGLLENLDMLLINWMLPLAALIISQVVVYRIDQGLQKGEFDQDADVSLARLYSHWRFAMRWMAPGLILVGIALQIL